MEAIRQVIRTPKSHEIKITIPQYVPDGYPVEIILVIKKKQNDDELKINQLKSAMNDEFFLKDLEEVSSDFQMVDLEGWKES